MARESNLLTWCFVLSVALVGCSGSSSNSTAYPSEVRETFVSSCVTNAESSGLTLEQAKDYCDCTFGIIQKEYSLEEFSDAEQAVLRGEASNIDFQEIAARCS